MTLDVDEVLKKITAENAKSALSTQVEKAIEPEFDTGNLLTSDTNHLELQQFGENPEAYLKSLARGNTQLLINEVWKLPVERIQDSYVAKLPTASTVLPREKPIPKDKPLTKWQEFAKLKGIKNKKKSRMVWDEKSQAFMPRWGYKRANDDTKEWAIEIPGNVDPMEDQFEKRNTAKRERVAKNELQRLRNIARRKGKKVPGVGELMPNKEKSISEMNTAFHHAKVSTASLGRFEEKLKDEKIAKGKKRKFDPLVQELGSEKRKQLQMLKEMHKKTSSFNVSKAVNRQLGRQEATSGGIKKGSAGKNKRKDRRR